jgi:hypothetical protein
VPVVATRLCIAAVVAQLDSAWLPAVVSGGC